ncbi:MAG TPA: flagellin [Brevundimonas sp.]|uniref:flagellin n=1 Tax=Brevundimonas sp. TaxID=1871086 RepID=UPI00260348DD|nr:flagellin [Brevundimonas sp.]HRO31836.1 flagellin [Brevundimonas sp.]
MSLNSVNTNVGALVALQNLQATNAELASVQSRINTGKKINSAKDNGAIWAIAQGQRAELGALNAVKDSLQRGQSAVDVGLAAGETVSDLLSQMKEKALAATDTNLGTAARNALNEDFVALRKQIASAVSNAKFNGISVISGTAGFKAMANSAGSATIDVAAQNMSLSGSIVTLSSTAAITTATMATARLAQVNASLDNVSTALARLGTGSKALGTHLTFVGKLQDSLETGIGNLVDADLAKESARLQALQTKQQLGVQALSIANSSTSILLGLFR